MYTQNNSHHHRAPQLRGFRLFTMLLLCGFTAAIASPSWAKTISVTVAEYSSKTDPYFKEAARAFERANPGMTVQIKTVPWNVLLQKLTTDISGNANTDLAIIGTRWLLDFVSEDVVEPLDSYMTPEFKRRLFPVFFSPSQMDGKTYGLPIAASARAMYYNKTLLKKAGISGPPRTWAELRTAAERIRKNTKAYGFGLQGKAIETDVYFYYALWSFGGDILENGRSGLGSNASIEAATFYKDLVDDRLTQPGVTDYTREDLQNLFKQGRVGMIFSLPVLSGQLRDETPNLDYGVAPVPRGSKSATYGVTDSIIMFRNSKAKQEAFSFLEFIFRKDWRAKFTLNENFLPVHVDVAKLPAFAKDADLKSFAAMLPNAHFAPVVRGWEEIADKTVNAMQKIYLGQASPKQALQEAETAANLVLDR